MYKKNDHFFIKRAFAYNKSMTETQSMGMDIKEIAVDSLIKLGFDSSRLGVHYIGEIIEDLYHERNVFDSNNKYFDLDDKDNLHYQYVADKYHSDVMNVLQEIDYCKDDVGYDLTSNKLLFVCLASDIYEQVNNSVKLKKIDY